MSADMDFRMLGEYRKVSIRYARDDTSFEIYAIPLLADRYADEYEGTVLNVRKRDYIVKTADLMAGLPKQGDLITHGTEIWMLLETPFKEMTASGDLLRLYAQYHKDVE